MFEFTKDLELGNERIDYQHMRLIGALNKLSYACTHDYGKEDVGEAVDFLIVFTREHFVDEEALQLKCGFPGYEHHKKLHEDFAVFVESVAQELKESGPTEELVNRVNAGMGMWLILHIQEEDKKIADHIRQKKAMQKDATGDC